MLTYAGCSLSVFSLLILLVIYCTFKELRTLPGKNLVNVSLSMICYHMFLFVAGLKTIQEVCTGIAVFLHYFLMCSFAWMSVMAFDVTKTFVFHGKTLYHSFSFSEISNTQRCCHFAHRLLHREVISPQRLFVFSDSRPAKFTEFLNFLSFLCRY